MFLGGRTVDILLRKNRRSKEGSDRFFGKEGDASDLLFLSNYKKVLSQETVTRGNVEVSSVKTVLVRNKKKEKKTVRFTRKKVCNLNLLGCFRGKFLSDFFFFFSSTDFVLRDD